MSPTGDGPTGVPPGFPRVSGDEPENRMSEIADLQFSPRERG